MAGNLCAASRPLVISGDHAVETLDPDLEWILLYCGLDPCAYRPKVLQRRVPACLRKLRLPDLRTARQFLAAHPEHAQEILNAFLLGVSGWFRDPDVFENLQVSVLPDLLAVRSGLRVLSAGCSDGQELYSVAMLLDEYGALDFSQLLGIDCRQQATRNACSGEYSAACLEDVPSDKHVYFDVSCDRVKVVERLRHAIHWRNINLFDIEPALKWELVLFRNVAIYLGPNQCEKLFRRFAESLVPGGVLVTGKAERPPEKLGLLKLGPCIYRKPDVGL